MTHQPPCRLGERVSEKGEGKWAKVSWRAYCQNKGNTQKTYYMHGENKEAHFPLCRMDLADGNYLRQRKTDHQPIRTRRRPLEVKLL